MAARSATTGTNLELNFKWLNSFNPSSSADERRRRLQERIDALLDRINEVGGLDGLTPDERRELADASAMLRRETAGG